ncbi:MAG TPA: PAS domain-containing protein, partial [Chitinophagaceae bacterium]|nr:PAS domain-containing protein [Chitinophagaceae bacterium]
KHSMKLSWTTLKGIISSAPKQDDLYLTLIDEEGTIACANSNMLRDLELDNPRKVKTNFFDLLHPINVDDFKKIICDSGRQNGQGAMELYIKNGYYHPMKWQVRSLEPEGDSKHLYFCIGYKILDEGRLKIFNELAQKHYQLIIEDLTGIIFHNRKGELIAANHKASSLLSTSLERLYQLKNISALWDTEWMVCNENGERVLFENTPFMQSLKTSKPQKQVLGIRLKDGELRWFLFNSKSLSCDAPCCDGLYVVSSIIDVTREKHLHESLGEKQALLKAFVSQTPNLAWVIDEAENLQLASSAFYRYFNLDESTSVNKQVADLVPAFVYNALHEKHLKVFETGEAVELIEKVRLANGANYVSHINIFPIDIPGGAKLVGGYAVNLPDTKVIEAELREANERLLTLTRAASNAIWEWDMQTGKIFRNEVLREMIGYQMVESKGLSWWLRRIHPEDRNRVSDKVKEATDTYQHSWQSEYRFKCADGTYKHIQDKGFVIYENGLPVKMIGSLHDISDLKELENKLADEQIQRQKEISETVIQVQEKERTRIGHELHDNVNQILSTTMLFIDTLNPENKDQKLIKTKSIEYLKMAIEEIRKLSKELVVPQFKQQGLVESIRALIEDIQLAHPIRIKFTHDLDTDLLSSGKKITLFRIVQEQMKNILKHSKARNAEILLQVKHQDVELVIKDNGIGFDSTLTPRGIGFSNIYERVSFYNGTVDIQTSRGKGCMVAVGLSVL